MPYTLNGKRVEVPVKKACLPVPLPRGYAPNRAAAVSVQIINGASITSVNPATLRNPECLALYEEIGVTLRREVG